MKYMAKEWHMLVWGTIALVISNVGTLVIPIYIGWFIDDMNKRDFDHVYVLFY